jgi:glutamyl-tRNA synthetase
MQMLARKLFTRANMAAQVLWLDQADALAVSEGEEVTLMDWGNAIIRVRAL